MRNLFHHLVAADLRLRAITLALAVAVTLGAIGGLAHLANSEYDEAMTAHTELSVPTYLVHINADRP